MKLLVVGLLLLFPVLAAAARPRCGEATFVFGAGEGDSPVERFLAAYGRLVGEIGAGVLTAEDLAALRDRDPFELDPAGRAEALPVAEGFRALGAFARQWLPGESGLGSALREILQRELVRIGGAGEVQLIVKSSAGNVPSPFRWIGKDLAFDGNWSLSSDGRHVVTLTHGGGKSVVRIFETDSGKPVLEMPFGAVVFWARLGGSGDVLTLRVENRVTFWKLHPAPGDMQVSLLGNYRLRDSALVGLVEGGTVALLDSERSVHAVEVAGGRVRNRVKVPDWVEQVSVSPDERFVAVVSQQDSAGGAPNLFLYDGELWARKSWLRRAWNLTERRAESSVEGLQEVQWSADGKLLFTIRHGIDGNEIAEREVPSLRVVRLWRSEGSAVRFGVSADGASVLVDAFVFGGLTTPRQRRVKVFDRYAGVVLAEWVEVNAVHQEAGFVGTDMVWTAGDGVTLWRVGRDKPIFESGGSSYNIAYDAVSGRLYDGQRRGIRVWHLRTLAEESR